MKSIKVYAADEIIDDIKKTAKLLNMSASSYLVHRHAMKQEKKYPGKVRGSNVSAEIVPLPYLEVSKKSLSALGFTPQPKRGAKKEKDQNV